MTEELKLPIGEKEMARARELLQKYREGKANLERKIVENEQWYKMRHWECMKGGEAGLRPVSGWLFNSIAGKHADAMDNIPSPIVLPREEGDAAEAEMLSAILPVILEQSDFEEVYSEVWDYKLKTGTGVYGVFWDPRASRGLGDVRVKKVDVLNLFWEPGVRDIAESRNLFHVELVDNEVLEAAYPQLSGKLSTPTVALTQYLYDDRVDTSDRSVVVDWYYKKPTESGRMLLHYCKFVNDTLLFASENEPERYENGWYAHGEYPFVFDTLYRVEGTPCGFGFIDVGKDAQAFIDRGNEALLRNMLQGAAPRYFVREAGGVNEEEFCDLSRELIHVSGGVGEDHIRPVESKPLPAIYLNLLESKIDELKEVTGNRDTSTGGTATGVTAASAIAAIQEAGSKLSRDNNRASHRAFRRICLQIIELLRQFYTLPRCFRIMGEDGTHRFVNYSNERLCAHAQGEAFGVDFGYRVPLFDIKVGSEKASPYSRLSQNELALSFFGAGFFNPARASEALACLEMMDFERKQSMVRRIEQMQGGMTSPAATGGLPKTTAVGEAAGVKAARERVATAATPN